MKKGFVIVISLLFICIVFALPICAEGDTYKLYNKDAEVVLSQPIVEKDEELYIALENLSLINLSYTKYDNYGYIEIRRSNNIEHICADYCTININSTTDYYVTQNGIEYINLNSIINVFSNGYSIDETTKELYLYINDGDTITLSGTITIPDNLYDETKSVNVKVYYSLSYKGSSGSSGISSGGSGYLGFRGEDMTDFPSETNLIPTRGTIKEEKKITIPAGQKEAEYSFEVKLSSFSSSQLRNYSVYIGYVIDDENYIGAASAHCMNLWDIYEKEECQKHFCTKNITLSYQSKKYISGTVTVPEHSGDLGYTIYAEANRTTDEDGNISRSKVMKTSGIIPAGETTSQYLMLVLPNYDYYVYIVFSNREYIRQNVQTEVLTEDTRINFDNFVVSNKVKGRIDLPEDFSTAVDMEGNTLEEITINLTLQGWDEPHYIVDNKDFEIDISNRYAEFELVDDVGIDRYVVYYTCHNIKDLYHGGNYKDDTECVPNVKYAKSVEANTENVIINMIPGKTVYFNTVYSDGADEYCPVNAVVQYENDKILSASESDLAVWCDRLSRTVLEDESVQISYYVTVPTIYDRFIIEFERYNDGENGYSLYKTEDGFSEAVADAKVFGINDEIADIEYNKYEPVLPLIVKDFKYDTNTKIIEYSLLNPWDVKVLNARIYIVVYGNAGVSYVYADSVYLSRNSGCKVEIEMDDAMNYAISNSKSIKIITMDADTLMPLGHTY